MHGCNNRMCVARKHLKLGTDAMNLKYMRDCGRGYMLPVGDSSHSAIFTNDQVRTAREMASDKIPYKLIAQKLKAHPSHISRMVRGLSRKTANGSITHRLRRVSVSEEQKTRALSLRYTGASQVEIARKLNLSRVTIYRILARHMETKHHGKPFVPAKLSAAEQAKAKGFKTT